MCRHFAFRVYISSKSELDYTEFQLFSNVLVYGCMNTKMLRSDKTKTDKTNKPTTFGLFSQKCCPVRESKFQNDVVNVHDMQVGEATAEMPGHRGGLRA